MNKINFPLKQRMKSPAVDELQDGLRLLLDRGVILTNDEAVRLQLDAALRRERSEQTYGDATSKLVSIFQHERRLEATGAVDEATAAMLNRALAELDGSGDGQPAYVVTGTVRFFDGYPVRGVRVSAFDRDLRREQALGQGQTDGLGIYRIPYTARQFLNAEKINADIVVKVFAEDGTLLVASSVLFNAPSVAEVDLKIPAEVLQPPTLFERITRALAPLLHGLKAEELEEDKEHLDLSFLTGETGFEKPDLARYVLAHRLAQKEIPAEFWFVLVGGSFHEFTEGHSLEEQMPAVLDALPSLDAAALQKSLIRGFNQKEIAESLRRNVPGWVEAFLKFIASRSLSGAGEPSFVKSALDDARITDAKKQETFARLFNEHRALTPELVNALEKDRSFSAAEMADLRTSFQIRDLTGGDSTVVKMLKQEFNVRQPEQIRTLAKRSAEEWVKLVQAKHAAGAIKLPIEVDAIGGKAKLPAAEVYGKTLERQFREAFPTAAFVGGLERALHNGGARGLPHADVLSKFLERHASFELLNTSVDDFLKNGIHADFRALAKDENFRLELKAVQRVFKLAPTFAATDALLADGLHSAQQIYRLGESEFVRRYAGHAGFTAESARLAWNRAADTHAAVLTIVADLKALEAEALPLALQKDSEALKSFPNWNNLFQTGDLCECEHCRSVLSPAAYFSDLLMFLKDRKATDPTRTVKDVLFARRPDLGYLELNCENALTPFPYVDTVCEVLEDAVAAGENDLELPGFAAIPSDPAAAKAAVAAAFAGQGIRLGADFSLSQVSPSDADRWVAHGDDVTYLLKKKPPAPNFFAEVLRNTKASAAELRAYPRYVNPKAYEKLRAAKYPLGLPFDLFAEEARAAFQKTNLRRWDLMLTLRGPAAPNNPTNGEVAAEYFGISVDASAAFDEKRLILVADVSVAGQKALWGEAGADWLGKVGNVKRFLQKTGLEYNEMLALLDLKFINPDGDITVHHLDASCDTDKKVIQVLDASKLDRIHRFLRLWRKLKGWNVWELDLVLRHSRIGSGALDEPFLVNLFHFSRLRNRLGGKTTVEQVSALFGDLNTESRFAGLHEKREDALYQSLFQNRRVVNPPDPAFQFDTGTGDLPVGETIGAHHSTLQAALGIGAADLALLAGLTRASNGAPYITDDLTLGNVSFLWRHAWLARLLKLMPREWQTLLQLFQQDMLHFADPETAWKFVEHIDHVKASDFAPDQLGWLLAADRSAKAATKETAAARFLGALRKELQSIRAEYDPTAALPTDVDGLTALLTSLLQKLGRDETAAQFFIATLRDEISQEAAVAGLPAGFTFPATITGAPHSIPIRYDAVLRFTGLMTAAQRATLLTDPALAGVTGITAYRDAIEAFFTGPRLALKFFEPVFTAPLAALPAAVNFQTVPDAALVRKISYDAEQRLLRFAGILSNDEKAALEALSADAAYRNALNSLAAQPGLIAPSDARVWLLDSDLMFPLRDPDAPAGGNLAENLSTAATGALAYLSRTLADGAVVRQASAELELAEALTRSLLTDYALLPDTLLAHLTGGFAATAGAVDYATLKTTFDGWFWATRAAVLLKKWKITLAELEKITTLAAGAQLLDPATLPLDATGPIAAMDRLLRTSRLLRQRDGLPETGITLLEVLEKLAAGAYPTAADFATDVQGLNDAWSIADLEALIASLDLAYPADYLLAETWERLRRAFYFLDNLHAGVDAVKTFAAAAMTAGHARALRDMLRSRFGADAWLVLSADIQDALRERKRDALAAYLLTRPAPAGAPSKWESTNDLYAHYLLDVEMCSCQLTSRLVQGSGSVQLFVQRCFMGLEPDVEVQADSAEGDSAWRWWQWMRKYRLWEANRKVFLWPENWIEPELKKDRSPFFKDLENELLQNEVNPLTVENAFSNYLEKLDGVAQLEIAGFYQEDDGDNTIVHIFGRTSGTEPHEYYYRRFDYRQCTPWEKVELAIKSDYLIPAVVNKRLFLFWPVFTEVPDEVANSTANVPNLNESGFPLPKTWKKLKVQMAVSDYRQGKWTPERVSKDFLESGSYSVEIVRKHYRFYPVDRNDIDGRFGIKCDGWSLGSDGWIGWASLFGAFEIDGCTGAPTKSSLPGNFKPVVRPELASTGSYTAFLKWAELGARSDAPENDFTLENAFPQSNGLRFTPLLMQTPQIFRMSPPWHLSYLDKLLLDGLLALGLERGNEMPAPAGSWLPFFYNDRKRTFFVLPSLSQGGIDRLDNAGVRKYYPEIKKDFRQWEAYFEDQVQTWLDGPDLTLLTPPQRQQLEQLLHQRFPEEVLPPYTDAQLKNLMKRFLMRFFHFYMGAQSLQLFQNRQFHFKNFYHPFVCDLARLLRNPIKGISALMSRETQLRNSGFSFRQTYVPTPWVVELTSEESYPKEVMEFTPDGAYSCYNWELFFHAPLLIANALSKNQRFAEARDWYHFIFNPIGVDSPAPGGSPMSKYWITKPFFETTDPQYIQQRIDNILRMLAGDTAIPGSGAQAKKDLEDQVRDWRTNPFEPHRIASYRTVAYQKNVVMKYLDNLIAWGDYLFRQDSMESINEATQLYILAAEILGPEPKRIPPRTRPPLESFNELETALDRFSNALVQVENLVPPLPGSGSNGTESAPLPMLYFCIPQNDKMIGYWDTVADRLYKIRHCMNIEGVVRQLALFEPPLDSGALVKAAAAGVDVSSAIADLNAPLPIYRFAVLLQKANEVCNDVKALGSALLAALEKKDAEALGLLRQSQEIHLLEAVTAVREMQIQEAKEGLESIKKNKELIALRRDYYQNIERISASEKLHQAKLEEALGAQQDAQFISNAASLAHVVPSFEVGSNGAGGSPKATVMFGGPNVGSGLQAVAGQFTSLANVRNYRANKASINAGHERRWEEWKLQERLANKELEQVDKSIAAAELRIAIAEKDLENHLLQIENAKATDDFLRSKYTNLELYQWQVGQIASVYFQSYRLAYDLAKRAERCFRFELGVADASYLQFGYWDSLKKGLLAGENLQYDLRRLEAAYVEQNRREFELTKHVSLLLLDPQALVLLRETGRCFFRLPEEIFDIDFPGHYFRRIKSVSISLPCVAGPYTTISCTLRLVKNSIRINTAEGDNGYPRNTDEEGAPTEDDRFVENSIAVKAIAASSAQNDSGVFELSFRDERYLPFEGAGAVSEWSLELFSDLRANNPDPDEPDFGSPLRQFDYASISDAIVHVKYAAREDAGEFKNGAIRHLREHFSGQATTTSSFRMFNLRQEFPSQWHRFLHPADTATGNVFELEVSPSLFRTLDREKTLNVNKIWILARCADAGAYQVAATLPPAGSVPVAVTRDTEYGDLHVAEMDVDTRIVPTDAPNKWQLRMTRPGGGNLEEQPGKGQMEVEDLLVVLGYAWESS